MMSTSAVLLQINSKNLGTLGRILYAHLEAFKKIITIQIGYELSSCVK